MGAPERDRDALLRFALLGAVLGAAATGASCGLTSDDGVVGVDVDVTTSELATASVSEVFGVYGPSCRTRTGPWSIGLAEGKPTQYPSLGLVLGDTACTLLLTGVVVDASPLRASPAFALDTTFQDRPSALTDGAGVERLAVQAKLSSRTFMEDVRLHLRVGRRLDELAGGGVSTSFVYSVGGSASGLTGEGLLLGLSGKGATSVLAVTREGPFVFPTSISRGPYAVTVLRQPNGGVCTVRGGLGTIRDRDVESVSVTCTPRSCDDGNRVSGDGCSADLIVESGWICPVQGAACVAARCGDGLVRADEECDDGDAVDDDGCTATCRLAAGYTCPVEGTPCVRTVCGDGRREGSEQCDDGNGMPFDGCSPTCVAEPLCPKTGGACEGVCGDGIVFPGESCDDGNTRSGDGCSSTCTLEPGFSCRSVVQDLAPTVDAPIVYRDFSRGDAVTIPAYGAFPACNGRCPSAHPDFQTMNGAISGMLGRTILDDVEPAKVGTLDAEGKPVLRCIAPTGCVGSTCATAPGASTCRAASAESFAQWYRDLPGTGGAARVNHTLVKTLPLSLFGAGTTDPRYAFSSSAFFPIDDEGFGNQSEGTPNRNFHFTSELRFWFLYDGASAPRFDFLGDDDVFVFLNGKLVVDIGGVHGPLSRSFTLDAAAASKLGLAGGSLYEFALFQAERRRSGSNYQITLRGFVRAKSVCSSTCGDGVVTRFEACDDGSSNDTNVPPALPRYGKCGSNCLSRGPRCGDGIVQPEAGEACDDGEFNGSYGMCALSCAGPGPRCGDGVLQTEAGEVCDEGDRNETTSPVPSGTCAADCASRWP